MWAPALAGAVSLMALVACSERAPGASTPAPSAVGDKGPATAVASGAAGDQLVAPAGRADRLPPPEVPPVVRDGVTYAQADDARKAGLTQAHGVLLASDAPSGKLLWTLVVYAVEIDPKLEADVQWVFFRSMAFEPDGRLRIVNEAGKAFLVDVKARTVISVP